MPNATLPAPPPTNRERREQARLAREAAARELRRRRVRVLGGATLVITLAIAALVLMGGRDHAAAPAAGPPAGVAEVDAMLAGVPQDGIALGDPGAPVTLVEFADMQCPFCRDFARQTLPLVVRDYVRTGKVRLEFRPLAFLGPDSERAAAVVAGAAAQHRLWQMADLFYSNQGRENSGYATDAFLRRLLDGIPGLDVRRALQDAASPAADRLLADAEALARRHAIASTPSFLIGRTGAVERATLAGAPDYATLRARLDALLRKRP